MVPRAPPSAPRSPCPMSEPLARALVVASALVVALAVAFVAWRGPRRRARAVALDLSPLEPGTTVFFTDPVCATCDTARARLRSAGVTFVEVSYGSDPELMRAVGVEAVPLVVVVDRDGGESARIVGVPTRRGLASLGR